METPGLNGMCGPGKLAVQLGQAERQLDEYVAGFADAVEMYLHDEATGAIEPEMTLGLAEFEMGRAREATAKIYELRYRLGEPR